MKMMKYSKDDFKTRLFSSKIFIVCAFIILVFAITAVAKELYRKYQIQEEISALKEEIEKVEKSNREFSDLIEYLKTESYLEKGARLRLYLQKPGEKVVIVSQNPQGISEEKYSDGAEKAEEEKKSEEISNPRKWWNYLFAID